MNKKEKIDTNSNLDEKYGMSRREAIRKMGYAAFAASTMFLLLNNPTKAYAQSQNDPGDPGDDWEW
jgi:hypothetical protein